MLDINSYADDDDTSLCSCAEEMSSVITELQWIAEKKFRWFENNDIKVNPGKKPCSVKPQC